MHSPNIRYLPAIDHLRGFAALLIVLYHGVTLLAWEFRFHTPFGFSPWMVAANPLAAVVIEGHTSVGLFMVLSGFIFTFGAGDRAVRYAPFLRNRILRIYPLFFCVFLMGAVVYPQALTLRAMTLTLFGLANVQGAADLGIFSAMFWTVAVEIQFYLLFPLLHRLRLAHGPAALVGLLGVAIVMRFVGSALGASPLALSYFTIFGRIDQFLIGMLAGWLYTRRGTRWRRGLRWGLLPALAGVCSALLGFNRLGGWPIDAWWKLLWPPAEGMMWAIVVLCYLAVADLIGPRASRLMAAFGVISYSAYLLHFPLIHTVINRQWWASLSDDPVSNAVANTLLVILPLVTVVATCSYHLVERPFLSLRTRYLADRPVRRSDNSGCAL